MVNVKESSEEMTHSQGEHRKIDAHPTNCPDPRLHKVIDSELSGRLASKRIDPWTTRNKRGGNSSGRKIV